MAEPLENPLVSSKPSDTGTTVCLHPLVLLTASDQITRHRVRSENEPLVGIILGQQKGREITAEHAFVAALVKTEAGQYEFKQPWLGTRIQQYRDVHKAPALDAVGWYTLCSENGPLPELVPFQKQLTSLYNDNAIFLAIHPEAFESAQGVNQKLPITVYEGIQETDTTKDQSSMQVDGEEHSDLRFRVVPYTVETDEAEMIAIDYVAKGAGSAAAVAEPEAQKEAAATTPPEQPAPEDAKGKKRSTPQAEYASKTPTNDEAPNFDLLTPEEQDTISGVQTRLNSVKMLQSRLDLLTNFLKSLTPSYISSQTIPLTADSPSAAHLPHLRSIQALLTRLSLLTPPHSDDQGQNPLEAATKAQANDVALSQMLSIINHDVQSLSELGKKFAAMDGARTMKKNKGGGMQTLSFSDVGGMVDVNARKQLGFGTGSVLV